MNFSSLPQWTCRLRKQRQLLLVCNSEVTWFRLLCTTGWRDGWMDGRTDRWRGGHTHTVSLLEMLFLSHSAFHLLALFTRWLSDQALLPPRSPP